MNDLKLEHNKSDLTIDEVDGGIVIRIKELKAREWELKPGAKPIEINSQAQIWLDTRAILRLYAFLRDVIPDSEDLNGQEIH